MVMLVWLTPLPRTLHVYSSNLFYLLMGNTPNLLVFDNSALDMDIVTLCKYEEFNFKLVFFGCYLEVHQMILNPICAMLQSCKHLPKAMFL
jgi:hypothetical protein